jgi:hypothetical protein
MRVNLFSNATKKLSQDEIFILSHNVINNIKTFKSK